MSETKNLAAALAQFQAEMPTVPKGKTAKVEKDGRALYSYQYADLADVSQVAMPLLAKNGLSFACLPEVTDRGAVLTGMLMHTSGESISGSLPIQGSNRPQDVGSALTYARRYLFGCITGLVTDADDDGALAQHASKRRQKPADDPWAGAENKPVSEAQTKLMGQLMARLGMTDRALALTYVKDVIGREVQSRTELTVNEASKVIESLKADEKAGNPA